MVFENWFLLCHFIFVHIGHVIYMVGLNLLLIGTFIFVMHLCSQSLYGFAFIMKLWDICLLGLSSQSGEVFQFALWVTKIKGRLILIHSRVLLETHFWCGHDLSGVLNLLQFRLQLIRQTTFDIYCISRFISIKPFASILWCSTRIHLICVASRLKLHLSFLGLLIKYS